MKRSGAGADGRLGRARKVKQILCLRNLYTCINYSEFRVVKLALSDACPKADRGCDCGSSRRDIGDVMSMIGEMMQDERFCGPNVASTVASPNGPRPRNSCLYSCILLFKELRVNGNIVVWLVPLAT